MLDSMPKYMVFLPDRLLKPWNMDDAAFGELSSAYETAMRGRQSAMGEYDSMPTPEGAILAALGEIFADRRGIVMEAYSCLAQHESFPDCFARDAGTGTARCRNGKAIYGSL